MIRSEKGTGAWAGGDLERILGGGEDAPLEARDLRFIIGLLVGIVLVAVVIALVASVVGWV